MGDVMWECGRRDVNSYLFALFNNEGVFIKRKIHFYFFIWLVACIKIRYLIDIVTKPIIAFFLAKTQSHIEAGVLAVGFDCEFSCYLTFNECIVFKFGRIKAYNIVSRIGLVLPSVTAEV